MTEHKQTPPSKPAQWWAKIMNWLEKPSPSPNAVQPPPAEQAKMTWADDGGAIPPPADEPPPKS